MTLEQLRVFLAVAYYLNFTRAAESLFVTQSAVSASIRKLECQCGAKLFERLGRQVYLTKAGNLLRLESQKVIDQVEHLKKSLKELEGFQRGELLLGASFTAESFLVPGVIVEFNQAYPKIQVKCAVRSSLEVISDIITGKSELGIITGENRLSDFSCLQSSVIGQDQLRIVVGKNHPWFNMSPISIFKLVEAKWILRETGAGDRQTFESFLQTWGVNPNELNIALEFNSSQMIKKAIIKGMGAGVISELMIAEELERGLLQCVEIENTGARRTEMTQINHPFLLISHKDRAQSKFSKAFEQMLSK